MNFGYISIFFALLTLASYALNAQDTMIVLPEVEVKSSRLEKLAPGVNRQTIELTRIPSYQTGSLAEVIDLESSAFVKNYGPASLSTLSVRGGLSTQTAVLWNGLNLQSPLNGTYDLRLIPVFFIDGAELFYNGISSLVGNGSVSGSLNLSSVQKFEQPLNVKLIASIGSFEKMTYGVSLSDGGNKITTSTRIYYTSAENNYPFSNHTQTGNPLQYLENSAFKQFGIQQLNQIRINNRQALKFHFEHLMARREIPPTMLMSQSNSKQQDYNTHAGMEWNLLLSRTRWSIKGGIIKGANKYQDPDFPINAENRATSFLFQPGMDTRLGDHFKIEAGLDMVFTSGKGDGFEAKQKRNETGLFSTLSVNNPKGSLNAYLNLRQSMVNAEFLPLIPSIGFKWAFAKNLFLKAHTGRNYKLPSFNDLFWIPGGNPDLLPERGWSQEMTIGFNQDKTDNNNFGLSVTVFNSQIQNLIIWLPENNIWGATNQGKVWSRGAELSSVWVHHWNKKLHTTFQLNGTLLKSTNEQDSNPGSQTLHKQVIYTPGSKWNMDFGFAFNGFSFNYQFHYVGKRYITADNESYLEPYYTSDIHLAYKSKFGNSDITGFFTIKNLLNQPYEIIAYRPMPGSNYELGFILNLINRNKK